MGDFSGRVLDTSASGKAKLSAPKNGSLSSDINNLSAKSAAKIKDLKGKASGLLGALRGKKGGHIESDETEEAADAFNAAGEEYEPTLFAEIREGWVRRHMVTRVADYTSYEPLKISVLTWNVAAKKPPPTADLAALLAPIAGRCSIFAIGLQESVELSAHNVGAGADGRLAGTALQWEAAISAVACGGAGHEFHQVVCRQMMGILLLVYVHRDLRSACSTPRTCSVGTGLLVRSRRAPTSHMPTPHIAHATRTCRMHMCMYMRMHMHTAHSHSDACALGCVGVGALRVSWAIRAQ